jgi:hypothetical protein
MGPSEPPKTVRTAFKRLDTGEVIEVTLTAWGLVKLMRLFMAAWPGELERVIGLDDEDGALR